MNANPQRRSVVVCPKAKLPASVVFDTSLAIGACSRAPRVHCCDRACLPQLRFASEDLESFVSFYNEQGWCRICGNILTANDWYASRMAAATSSNSGYSMGLAEGGQQICWRCAAGDICYPSAQQGT
jgi:hypothetical protein